MSGSVAHDKIEQNIFVMGSSPLKAASHISPLMHLHVNKWMDGYRFKERWHHTQHSISHFQCYTIRVQGGSKRHETVMEGQYGSVRKKQLFMPPHLITQSIHSIA